jgi:hypothetical protein
MDIRAAGSKRVPSCDKERAKRHVFVPPALNLEIGMLSKAYYPDWLDADGTNEFQEDKEERNVEQKFGGYDEADEDCLKTED